MIIASKNLQPQKFYIWNHKNPLYAYVSFFKCRDIGMLERKHNVSELQSSVLTGQETTWGGGGTQQLLELEQDVYHRTSHKCERRKLCLWSRTMPLRAGKVLTVFLIADQGMQVTTA